MKLETIGNKTVFINLDKVLHVRLSAQEIKLFFDNGTTIKLTTNTEDTLGVLYWLTKEQLDLAFITIWKKFADYEDANYEMQKDSLEN